MVCGRGGHGIPTVTVTTDDIIQMSTEQAKALGLPKLPVVALGEALYGRPREEIARAPPRPLRSESVEAGLVG